jgi:hypothetical protein
MRTKASIGPSLGEMISDWMKPSKNLLCFKKTLAQADRHRCYVRDDHLALPRRVVEQIAREVELHHQPHDLVLVDNGGLHYAPISYYICRLS